MRRHAWILLLFAATSALAATKITVDQLKQTLIELRQTGKSDEDVATRLKEVELSEELNAGRERSLLQYLPGDLSTEQMLILQGRSAFLSPPASDLAASLRS